MKHSVGLPQYEAVFKEHSLTVRILPFRPSLAHGPLGAAPPVQSPHAASCVFDCCLTDSGMRPRYPVQVLDFLALVTDGGSLLESELGVRCSILIAVITASNDRVVVRAATYYVDMSPPCCT